MFFSFNTANLELLSDMNNLLQLWNNTISIKKNADALERINKFTIVNTYFWNTQNGK